MSSDRPNWRRLTEDAEDQFPQSSNVPPTRWNVPWAASHADSSRLHESVQKTCDYLLGIQDEDGFWRGELEGDTILESEYVLLLAFLGRGNSESARQAARYILTRQEPEGCWSNYPGGPLEPSVSVKAYLALKIAGHSPDADYMVRARQAILDAGGAERINSFTRYYLASLGLLSYRQCPAVPPEIMLLPTWMPFNIYEMSAWSRTIFVPLTLIWAHQPVRPLPAECQIRELFLNPPEQLALGHTLSHGADRRRGDWWERLFLSLDRWIKFVEPWLLKPLRPLAVRRATAWMTERFERSDGLGAIFPPIIWSIMALKCLGHRDDSPEVSRALAELEALCIREGDTLRLQPCQSPVWDTALSAIALRDAGVPASHPALSRAVEWLLSKEVRSKGDWSLRNKKQEPGGWFFEFHNAFYPDVDDTAMVLIALSRCLPVAGGPDATVELISPTSNLRAGQESMSAIVMGAGANLGATSGPQFALLQRMLAAMRRGASWLVSMQCRDGGWGAFDANNNRELFTRVPFADHNAMIDPSTADITARVVESLAALKWRPDHPAIRRAIRFVEDHQEQDHSWYGRWGVNYIYGTWQVIVGLAAAGISPNDPRIDRAARWLKSKQQPSGAWGESVGTYDGIVPPGQGDATPSQTAWALLGLMAAGEMDSEAVRRGIDYLLDTQKSDGTWDEHAYTGTGFPQVFYLKYHLYRVYFPLMALARYSPAKATVD